MPVHTPKEKAREKPDTGTSHKGSSHGSSHAPSTTAPSNSPAMSGFGKLGGISGRK